ncbi:hypothetical protein PHYSODRAFT_525490 [Phytophthora sojae]|uniref:Uncharacterized protein n=1 Tax=Phytophthora sojae (strain P6497) TaxID=1094619 RepID=G5A5Y4_PHYSP|nr:hypothetical protein PHYSODRAFT_525490 [Phytophthora sojae]EGZ08739.1 hypothetical protein PHYSODRAFT_525490 [Phytophthora sojae]|eukprot:XP_009535372.1 hypothetical protein PHYSODRAFT_525490 [Phytophthora sojae]
MFKCLLISALGVSAVNAHGWLTKPAATFDSAAGDKSQFIATIEASSSGFKGTFNTAPADNVASFTKAFEASKYKSLKEFIDDKAKITVTGATLTCGIAEPDAAAQPVPAKLEWSHSDSEGFTSSHEGPCEAWCDDTRVFNDENCAANFKTAPAEMPYESSNTPSTPSAGTPTAPSTGGSPSTGTTPSTSTTAEESDCGSYDVAGSESDCDEYDVAGGSEDEGQDTGAQTQQGSTNTGTQSQTNTGTQSQTNTGTQSQTNTGTQQQTNTGGNNNYWQGGWGTGTGTQTGTNNYWQGGWGTGTGTQTGTNNYWQGGWGNTNTGTGTQANTGTGSQTSFDFNTFQGKTDAGTVSPQKSM